MNKLVISIIAFAAISGSAFAGDQTGTRDQNTYRSRGLIVDLYAKNLRNPSAVKSQYGVSYDASYTAEEIRRLSEKNGFNG